MKRPCWYALSSRRVHGWRRFALSLAALLLCLFMLGGCGGSDGDHDDDDDDDVRLIPPTAQRCVGETFVEAPVQASEANAQSLTLLGLTVRVSDVSLPVLVEGDFVALRGSVGADGAIVATCLERVAARSEVELQGRVDAGGINEPRLSILGIEIQTDANTVFENGRLTQALFFAQVRSDDLVEVEGQLLADDRIRARDVEFEDDDRAPYGDDDDDGDFDDDDDGGLGSDDDDDGYDDDDDNGALGSDDDDDDDD